MLTFEIGRQEYGSYHPCDEDLASHAREYYINAYRRDVVHGTRRDTIADELTAAEALELHAALTKYAKRLLLVQ